MTPATSTVTSTGAHTPAPATIPAGEAITLVLAGARSLADVNTARKAVTRMPGVLSLAVRPAGGGVMYLHLRYAGIVPLEVHLSELIRRGLALPRDVTLATI
jgi:hypothetical protein